MTSSTRRSRIEIPCLTFSSHDQQGQYMFKDILGANKQLSQLNIDISVTN